MAWTDDRIEGGFEGLRRELRETRVELRSEMHEMRTELRAEMRDMRSEFRSEIGALRGDMNAWMRQQSMIGWGIAAALMAQLVAFVIIQS